MLMLHALFSARNLQQLLREGKLTNERIFFYPIILYLLLFPCLLLILFQFYSPEFFIRYSPLKLYGILCGGILVLFLTSQWLLLFFTTIFNYQEQGYLYQITKNIFRLFHGVLLLCMIPVIWYTRTPEILLFAYIPLFVVFFIAFFILFLKNISNPSRIHFFIYFCSLEILPCLLLIKLLISNL